MRKEYSITSVAPTMSAILNLPAPAQARDSIIQKMADDLSTCSRVAILATDALGMYAWGLWRAEMPYLSSLHARNSVTLCSVMPSITPVNFAAMVAGTDLAGHGVNDLKDDFACETLFDVIRKAKGKSAGVGLDGYTGSKLLGRFADICGNAGDGADDAVADKVIEIADSNGPEFLIAQLGRIDDVFHHYGPSSPAVIPMLKETDARLMRLVEHLKPLGYGVVILSDHGQHDAMTESSIEGHKGAHGTDRPEDCLVPCTWV